MSRVLTWFGCLLLFAASSSVAAPARFIVPGVDAVGRGGYRADRIELRLEPWAATTARAYAALAARTEVAGGRHVSPTLGLATVDRVAASVGVLAFEPEFRGETPPVVGGGGMDFTAFHLATLASGASVEAALAALRALPEVESADPIAILPGQMIPNDSLYSASWWFGGPPGINAPAAWSLSAGDSSVVIAILDTGVLPWHPDLGGTVAGSPGQLWTNTAEANGLPGVDDDGNGFVDDVRGWDFVALANAANITPGEDWRDEDNDPDDFASHGTEAAGLAAAITNNSIGVAGAAFGSRIMPLRVAWSESGATYSGAFDMSYVAQAIRYATRAGAKVINCSFQTVGEGGLFAAVDEATRAGVLVVSAAGNVGPCGVPFSTCHELADREDVLAVGGLAATGRIAAFSEAGEFVDVYAPGEAIQSTFLFRVDGDSIASRLPAYSLPSDGTSWSAPIAAGVAAQVLAYDRAQGRPALRPMELLFRLRETADPFGTTSPPVMPPDGAVGQLDAATAIARAHASFGIRAGARTTGAAVGLFTTGTTRIAVYATSDSALLFLSSRGDTLRRVALGAGVVGSPASADLGGGRGPGIFVALDNATVAGFDGYGALLAGWPVATDASDDPPGAGPSLGDVDDDAAIDVVVPTITGTVFVWHIDGSRVAPFPVPTDGSPPVGSVALANLGGALGAEIVLGTQGNTIYVLQADAATPVLPGWPKSTVSSIRAPIVMRLGHAGAPAIIVAYGTSLRAYRGNGTVQFTRPLGGAPAEDPVAADLNGDGADEIVVPLTLPEGLAAFDSTGTPLAGWPLLTLADPVTGPALVRVTSPADPVAAAVLLPSGDRLLAFDAAGVARGEFPKPGHAGNQSSLFDLGGDAGERVLAGSGADSLIYFYLPPGLAQVEDAAASWVTARGNFARTASRLAIPVAGFVNNVPGRVGDLAATSVTDSSVTLGWTATGDDSMRGRPLAYEISATPAPHPGTASPALLLHWTVPATVDAGGHESAVVAGLEATTTYTFGLIARDAQGETSLPSNAAIATTTRAAGPEGPLQGARGPAVIALSQPARLPVTIFWKAAPGMTRAALTLYDVGGRLRQQFVLGAGSAGSIVWNGADRTGAPLESGVYFLRLVSGSAHASARVVLIR